MSGIETQNRPAKKGHKKKASKAKSLGEQKSPTESPLTAAPKAGINAATREKLILGSLILVTGAWAYLPTSLDLWRTWSREQDYSHGFVVVPVAILILWYRRASFPGFAVSNSLISVLLLVASLSMRWLGSRYYLSSMDGWSIVPWLAALVTAIGGIPLLRWSLPAVGFLFFMVPLPFRLENELSGPLQRVATKISTMGLQLFGQPAFSEGNVILLENDRLEVAQACSGLRLFMSTFALTYVVAALVRRPWWEKGTLALAAIPIAIISNATRIIVTGLLYQVTDSPWLRGMVHDMAGWGMILVAATQFAIVVWYLKRLFIEEEVVDIASVINSLKGDVSGIPS